MLNTWAQKIGLVSLADSVVACLETMKNLPLTFLLLVAPAWAAETQPPIPTHAAPKDDYAQFVSQMLTPENMTDCIETMDRLITAGEHGLTDKEADQGLVEANTKLGLHFEFSTTEVKKEAIIYYVVVSRGGRELKYPEAAKFVALFADRVGLPHLIDVTEGDKCTFYAQWFFKPSKWKANHKLMVKYRAENRAEADPLKAFVVAIEREVQARADAQRQR